ncbi:MAG: Gfo/Idh/MocA family oxidoreductase [candidate division WS1 bacterium]|jgi:predicted dehydrogenase|nr:Gfo/Idh/MocA family oxidoreductase [candidate division WS1 bacterium]
MADVKVGIVGLGWAASGHAPAFKANPNCTIDALCTSKELSDEDILMWAGHPGATVYHDYDLFLKHPGLDVVDICTPHSVHAEQTVKAAEAGKHLMIEKPLAVNYEDLMKMKRAIDAADIKSTMYFELRFIPHYQFIHSALKQGLLGDITYYEVDYYHGIGPWYGQFEWNVKKDMGGSALITAGCHALDAIMAFAASEVDEVFGFSSLSTAEWAQPYEYDTTSTAVIKFADGSHGKCTSCIDCRQPYVFNVRLVGSEGTLWNDQMWTTQLDGLRGQEWMKIPTAQAESGDVLDHPYPPQIDDFIEAVVEDRDPLVSFQEAFDTHRVMFAIEKSLEEGRPVKLEEMEV